MSNLMESLTNGIRNSGAAAAQSDMGEYSELSKIFHGGAQPAKQPEATNTPDNSMPKQPDAADIMPMNNVVTTEPEMHAPTYGHDEPVPAHAEEVSQTEIVPSGSANTSAPVAIYESLEHGVMEVSQAPAFSVFEKDPNATKYRGEWGPSMQVVTYIGDQKLLLEYLAAQEKKYRVTMPIKACGIDPIIFKNMNTMGNRPDGDVDDAKVSDMPNLFYLVAPVNDQQNPPMYELIEVDGEKYLSCASQSLDEEYMLNVIAEATTSVMTYGKYYYRMVGYRKLPPREGEKTGSLLKTLRLNTYEMSVLINYMQEFNNLRVDFVTINGKSHICFTRE